MTILSAAQDSSMSKKKTKQVAGFNPLQVNWGGSPKPTSAPSEPSRPPEKAPEPPKEPEEMPKPAEKAPSDMTTDELYQALLPEFEPNKSAEKPAPVLPEPKAAKKKPEPKPSRPKPPAFARTRTWFISATLDELRDACGQDVELVQLDACDDDTCARVHVMVVDPIHQDRYHREPGDLLCRIHRVGPGSKANELIPSQEEEADCEYCLRKPPRIQRRREEAAFRAAYTPPPKPPKPPKAKKKAKAKPKKKESKPIKELSNV